MSQISKFRRQVSCGAGRVLTPLMCLADEFGGEKRGHSMWSVQERVGVEVGCRWQRSTLTMIQYMTMNEKTTKPMRYIMCLLPPDCSMTPSFPRVSFRSPDAELICPPCLRWIAVERGVGDTTQRAAQRLCGSAMITIPSSILFCSSTSPPISIDNSFNRPTWSASVPIDASFCCCNSTHGGSVVASPAPTTPNTKQVKESGMPATVCQHRPLSQQPQHNQHHSGSATRRHGDPSDLQEPSIRFRDTVVGVAAAAAASSHVTISIAHAGARQSGNASGVCPVFEKGQWSGPGLNDHARAQAHAEHSVRAS